MAVSTWITFGVDGSPGSTFLTLRINGRPSTPSRATIVSRIATRSNHRLLVEQNLCRSRSASASRSAGNVWAVSRSTIRPSLLRRAKWPPFLSDGVRRVASIANGAPERDEPAGDPRVGRGAEVVGVGDEARPVARRDQRVEQAGAEQRGVEVAVAGRTPLQVGVLGEGHRGQVLLQELGLLVLQELQGQPLDRQVAVAGQRRHRVLAGAEGVHEDQRQRCVVLLAGVEHLPGDDVEERQPAAHAEERLGAIHAHRGAEAAVQLDHHGAADGLRGVLVGDLDVVDRLHVERVDGRLGDHPGLTVLEQPVIVGEHLDRGRVDAGLCHLVAGALQTQGNPYLRS